MNHFRWIPAMLALVMLAGCVPSIKEDTELVTDESETEVETTIIPSMQLDKNFYKTLVPYKESAARGLVVSNIGTKFDVKEVEEGLMRLSQNVFNTNDYFFQEGQYLDRKTVSSWLARSNQTDDGLNPPVEKDMDPIVRAKEAPVYLAHLVEQNYLTKTKDNKVALAGVSIGLALNSIYYYQKEQYGEFFEEPIPKDILEKKGKEIAAEVLTRLRAREELKDVPIVIGLFKQKARNAIVPGTYFAYSVADAGRNTLDQWQAIDEEYVTFPMSNPQENYREMNTKFQHLKQDVDKYFANYTSVIGKAYYRNKKIHKLMIEIPIQFYGSTEIIGFSQYFTGSMLKHLPQDLKVEVSITSVNGAEAIIIKEPNKDEPFVHIYDY